MILSRLKGREAFNAAYFFGFFFNAFSLYWLNMVTPGGFFAAVAIVALYYTAVLTLFSKLYGLKKIYGIVAMPFLWVGMEYFRTLTQFAFPWSDLGYTQAYYSYILQFVSITSVHGLSFLIVTVNVLFWQVLRSKVEPARKMTAALSGFAIIIALTAFGWVVTPPIPLPGKLDIAVLQGSVPLEEKWMDGNEDYSFNLYDSLAQSVEDTNVVLYVWPETAAPSYLSHDHRRRLMIGRTARKSGGYHLVGALGADLSGETQKHFNSCYLFAPDGSLGPRHDKVKLVPFTEQVPYQDHMPFLRREFLTKYLTFIETFDVQWWSDFRPGELSTIYDIPGGQFGILICFESTFPEFSRQMILDGAGFLVGITNDTWFEHTLGVHMHDRIFVTRAVENRSWGVRAANSGLSYFVDDYGRIRESLPADTAAALVGKVRAVEEFSFFTRHGDVIGLASFLITVSLICILILIWLIQKTQLSRRSI